MKKFLTIITALQICSSCLLCAADFGPALDSSGASVSSDILIQEFEEGGKFRYSFKPLSYAQMPEPRQIEIERYVRIFSTTLAGKLRTVALPKPNEAADPHLASIIVIRDQLLVAGGYVNLCLAGSITRGLNAAAYHHLEGGNSIDGEFLSSCQVPFVLVIDCVQRSEELDQGKDVLNLPGDYRLMSDIEIIRRIFPLPKDHSLLERRPPLSVSPIRTGWSELSADKKLLPFFYRKSLRSSSVGSQLTSWTIVLDEQFAIDLLNRELAENADFLNLSEDAAISELDVWFSEHTGVVLEYRNLRKYTGRRAYGFYRKYKSGANPGAAFGRALDTALLRY